MIRISIVGTGGIAHSRMEAYRQLRGRCEIAAPVDIVPGKARRFMEEFGLSCDTYESHAAIRPRKYIDLAADAVDGNHVFLVNGKGERRFNATGVTGYPFFGQLILDCLNRTENAMTQAHALKAAELCLRAQEKAVWVSRPRTGTGWKKICFE